MLNILYDQILKVVERHAGFRLSTIDEVRDILNDFDDSEEVTYDRMITEKQSEKTIWKTKRFHVTWKEMIEHFNNDYDTFKSILLQFTSIYILTHYCLKSAPVYQCRF